RFGGGARGLRARGRTRADAREHLLQPGANRGADGRQVQGHRALREGGAAPGGPPGSARRGFRPEAVQGRPGSAGTVARRDAERGSVRGVLRDEVVTMPAMTMVQAINNALREEMRRDDRVIVLGEDVGRNGGGPYHSQSSEAYFCHTPGLKVVVPSTPKEAKGLLTASIRDPDPVMFLEPKKLYRSSREEVPEGEVLVPIGEAAVRRPGKDLSLIAYGYMTQVCLEAAAKASENGVEAEVIDLRTLVPLDEPTILASVKKTGRAVVVYEAPRTGGFGGEISAILAEKAIEYLRGPIVRVTGFDTPFPYTLEDVYMPNADRVLAAIDKVMAF